MFEAYIGALDRCKCPGLDRLLRDIFSPSVFPALQQWGAKACNPVCRPLPSTYPLPHRTLAGPAGTIPASEASAASSSPALMPPLSPTAPVHPTDPIVFIDITGARANTAQSVPRGAPMSKKQAQKTQRGKKGASKPGKALEMQRKELARLRHAQPRSKAAASASSANAASGVPRRLGILWGTLGNDIDQPIVVDDDDDDECGLQPSSCAASATAKLATRVPPRRITSSKLVDLTGDDDDVEISGGENVVPDAVSEAEMIARLDAFLAL